MQEQLGRYPRNAIPDFRTFSVGILPHLQNGDAFPSLTSVRHPIGDVARQIHHRSGVMVKDCSALARATSIGPSAVTGLEVSADTAGGNPRYGITLRGGNNDLLSTLWREVISLAGVARSFSSGSGQSSFTRTGAIMKIQVCSLAIGLAIAVPIAVAATAKSSAAPSMARRSRRRHQP
ncbi:hypothetical protein [Bradyrhizobium sp. LA6.12]|uniref:hypothetical protein n=1 Tax=unclassified Bradyrhizobium TaxID=2631580 RepID=UPI003399535D